MSTAKSTSWGGRAQRSTSHRSTSWGGARARLATIGVSAAVLCVPLAGGSSALAAQPSVVAGVDAAAAVRSVGATATTTAPGLALAPLTATQARQLTARGLRVAVDSPVALQSESDRRDESGADNSRDGDAANGKRLSVRDIAVPRSWDGEGSGVTVAVLDSGVDEVPALAGRVVQGIDLTGDGFADRYGHGTFVAGLIAGNGAGGGPTGIAPEARIVSVKVADSRGRSSVGRVALGLAWVMQHKSEYGITVANLSLTAGTPGSYDLSPLDALAEAAWFSGITVVVSAGNGGSSAVRTAPANDPFVITVGSIYDNNSVTKKDDRLSPFSNDGRTVDGFRKPELLSPGEHVRAVLPAGSALAAAQTTTGLPAGYGQLSGTSMSAAVTSGLAALLLEGRSATPDEVKGALVSSAGHDREVRLGKAARALGSVVANTGIRPSVALAAAYAQLFLHTTDYAQVDWNAVRWTEVPWASATWTNATWTTTVFSAATWAAATWASATWVDATWSDATWSDATWSDATWSDATWSDVAIAG